MLKLCPQRDKYKWSLSRIFFLGFLDFSTNSSFLNIMCVYTHSVDKVNNLHINVLFFFFNNLELLTFCIVVAPGLDEKAMVCHWCVGLPWVTFSTCHLSSYIPDYLNLNWFLFSSEFLQHPFIHSELNIHIKYLQHTRLYTRCWIWWETRQTWSIHHWACRATSVLREDNYISNSEVWWMSGWRSQRR